MKKRNRLNEIREATWKAVVNKKGLPLLTKEEIEAYVTEEMLNKLKRTDITIIRARKIDMKASGLHRDPDHGWWVWYEDCGDQAYVYESTLQIKRLGFCFANPQNPLFKIWT